MDPLISVPTSFLQELLTRPDVDDLFERYQALIKKTEDFSAGLERTLEEIAVEGGGFTEHGEIHDVALNSKSVSQTARTIQVHVEEVMDENEEMRGIIMDDWLKSLGRTREVATLLQASTGEEWWDGAGWAGDALRLQLWPRATQALIKGGLPISAAEAAAWLKPLASLRPEARRDLITETYNLVAAEFIILRKSGDALKRLHSQLPFFQALTKSVPEESLIQAAFQERLDTALGGVTQMKLFPGSFPAGDDFDKASFEQDLLSMGAEINLFSMSWRWALEKAEKNNSASLDEFLQGLQKTLELQPGWILSSSDADMIAKAIQKAKPLQLREDAPNQDGLGMRWAISALDGLWLKSGGRSWASLKAVLSLHSPETREAVLAMEKRVQSLAFPAQDAPRARM